MKRGLSKLLVITSLFLMVVSTIHNVAFATLYEPPVGSKYVLGNLVYEDFEDNDSVFGNDEKYLNAFPNDASIGGNGNYVGIINKKLDCRATSTDPRDPSTSFSSLLTTNETYARENLEGVVILKFKIRIDEISGTDAIRTWVCGWAPNSDKILGELAFSENTTIPNSYDITLKGSQKAGSPTFLKAVGISLGQWHDIQLTHRIQTAEDADRTYFYVDGEPITGEADGKTYYYTGFTSTSNKQAKSFIFKANTSSTGSVTGYIDDIVIGKPLEETANYSKGCTRDLLVDDLISAKQLITNAVVGNGPGEFSQSAYNAFDSTIKAIEAHTSKLNTTNATENELLYEKILLSNARNAFMKSRIPLPDGVYFYTQDGVTPATNEDITAGNVLNVSAQYGAGKFTAGTDVHLITAIYDNNKLVQVNFNEGQVSTDGSLDMTTTITVDSDVPAGCVMKAFLWADPLAPLIQTAIP